MLSKPLFHLLFFAVAAQVGGLGLRFLLDWSWKKIREIKDSIDILCKKHPLIICHPQLTASFIYMPFAHCFNRQVYLCLTGAVYGWKTQLCIYYKTTSPRWLDSMT